MRTFAWTGAALFAGSLLYFARQYVGPFGAPAPGTDVWRPTLTNLGLFTVFALHHSLVARSGAKALVTRVVPTAIERAAYVWVASLLFIAVCAWWQPVPGRVWDVTGPGAWALRAFSAAGAVFTLYSASVLDIFELAGTRSVMRPRAARTDLVARGPYALVRHPIYLAWLWLVWTPTTMTGTRLVFAAVSSFYLVVAIPFEERSLRATLGPAYAAYARRVRWRMVPFLY